MYEVPSAILRRISLSAMQLTAVWEEDGGSTAQMVWLQDARRDYLAQRLDASCGPQVQLRSAGGPIVGKIKLKHTQGSSGFIAVDCTRKQVVKKESDGVCEGNEARLADRIPFDERDW